VLIGVNTDKKNKDNKMKLKELKEYSNKEFKRIILNDNVIENIDNIRKELEDYARENNITLEETKEDFILDGDRIIIKPRRHKETIGKIVFRSKDYYFIDPVNGFCYGDIPKSSDIDSKGFILRDFNNMPIIKYELMD
jgi:hypothetical protein